MNIQNLSSLDEQWVRNELVSRVTSVVKYNELTVFQSRIRDYENYLWYNGRNFYKLKEMWLERMYFHHGKTDLIRRWVYGFYGMLDKLRLHRPKASSYIGKEYSKYAKNYENFVSYVAGRRDNKSEIDKVIHEWLLTGNGFFKVAFKKHKKKINKAFIKGRKWVVTEDTEYQTISYPYIKYISCFDAIIDPTGLNRITGERRLMTVQQISDFYGIEEKRLKELWAVEWTKERAAMPMQRIYRYDWNRVKDIRAFENTLVEQSSDECKKCEYIGTEKEWYSMSDWVYEVIDLYVDVKKGDTYQTYQALIVNGSIEIREQSDYPFDWPPIVHCKFIEVPWSTYGIGIGELGASYQAKADKAEMTKSVTQVVVSNPTIIKNETLAPWRKQDPQSTFQFRAWSMIQGNDTANNGYDILRLIDPNVIPLMSNEIANIEQKFFALIGLNSLIEWWAWPVEQTRAWVEAKSNSAKLWIYVTNLTEALSEVYEKCSMLMKALGTDVELDMEDWVDDDDEKRISVKDLYNGFKITFDTEDLFGGKSQKIEQLSQVLQYAGQYMQLDQVEWKLMVKDALKAMISNIDSSLPQRNQEEVEAEMRKELETEMKLMQIRAEIFPPQPVEPREDIKVIVNLKDIEALPEQAKAFMLNKYFDIPQETLTQQDPAQQQVTDWLVVQQQWSPFEAIIP